MIGILGATWLSSFIGATPLLLDLKDRGGNRTHVPGLCRPVPQPLDHAVIGGPLSERMSGPLFPSVDATQIWQAVEAHCADLAFYDGIAKRLRNLLQDSGRGMTVATLAG